MSVPPPATVRCAGGIVVAQGVVCLLGAVVLLLRGFGGADQRIVNGFGTAVWFVLVGAAVLAAGRALIGGRRWGRGLAVFANLLLLPVAWYAAVGSRQWGYGVPVAVLAVTVLGLLLSPPAVRWAARGDHRDAASSASSGPDTR